MIDKLKTIYESLEVRTKQLLHIGIAGGVALIFILGIVWSIDDQSLPTDSRESKPVVKQEVSNIGKAMKPTDDKEIWVDRLQSDLEQKTKEIEEIRSQNKLLEQQVTSVVDQIFESSVKQNNDHKAQQPEFNEDAQIAQEMATKQMQFPQENEPTEAPKVKKIARLGFNGNGAVKKTASNYLPAGSYAKAVLLTGSAVLTSVNAQSNPMPIAIRLIDDGNLPRGFTSRVRDAHLIGACWGEISAERMFCRLESMSWVEKDGKTVERKVEGWVIGEDGRNGLRGKVVDRSDDVSRQALLAGILSSMSSFFEAQATKSVYPVSPFGQTNAMSTGDMISGAGASGAGNALSKLAEFSIKRAEQMQPVILVSAGRVVDILFKSGVDVSPNETADYKIEQHNTNSTEMGDLP
jgi:conjugal transfer pilus assembly protein TraB